jgi:hypothetical protein
MSNKYHAGTEYTNEQRDKLDAAFHVWLGIDLIDAYFGYKDEAVHSQAYAAYREYEALKDKFHTENHAPVKRGVASGNQHGFTSVSTAQMVAAAASDDPEMVAEMSKVKSLVYGGRLAVARLSMSFDDIWWKLHRLPFDVAEASKMADIDETYAAASGRLGY